MKHVDSRLVNIFVSEVKHKGIKLRWQTLQLCFTDFFSNQLGFMNSTCLGVSNEVRRSLNFGDLKSSLQFFLLNVIKLFNQTGYLFLFAFINVIEKLIPANDLTCSLVCFDRERRLEFRCHLSASHSLLWLG